MHAVQSQGATGGHSREVLVLTRDPQGIAAAQAASAKLGLQARMVGTGAEALAHLAGPGTGPGHLVCDPSLAGSSWPGLVATLAEPATGTALVLVSPPSTPGPGDAARVLEDPALLAQ